ncbi:hypothetical protein [Gorillibacterium sp. sgz5001074]|uniref:hypothetical protein n=1 Tax=Gorillibacterium sp. sgz5001074 TaxID=3446695 RepID=UPI003F677F83
MTKQIIDMRTSSHSPDDAFTTPIPAAPGVLFGDIGLQMTGILPENLGNVRVLLTGYAQISGLGGEDSVTIRVFREGTAPVFVSSYPSGGSSSLTFGFSAVDFPPELVVAQGQVRYTATIENPAGTAILGAANFSGIAAAGTTTS